jgi:hypothetical protein
LILKINQIQIWLQNLLFIEPQHLPQQIKTKVIVEKQQR